MQRNTFGHGDLRQMGGRSPPVPQIFDPHTRDMDVRHRQTHRLNSTHNDMRFPDTLHHTPALECTHYPHIHPTPGSIRRHSGVNDFTAALATLEVMREENATQRVHEIGTDVQERWLNAAEGAGLKIQTGGLPALANFSVNGLDPLAVKTFITARMLEQGYLAGPNLYASIAHTNDILDDYITVLSPVFEQLVYLDDDDLTDSLPSGTAQSGFRRLT